jgi:hypothetical protein
MQVVLESTPAGLATSSGQASPDLPPLSQEAQQQHASALQPFSLMLQALPEPLLCCAEEGESGGAVGRGAAAQAAAWGGLVVGRWVVAKNTLQATKVLEALQVVSCGPSWL